MATAGYNAIVRSATSYNADGATGYTAIDALSVSFSPGVDLLDITALDDGQFRKRIQGLKDCEVSITCDWVIAASSTGQANLRDSYDDDQQVYVSFFPEGGTDGYVSAFRCTGYPMDVSVDGKVSVTYNLVLNVDSSCTSIVTINTP